MPSPLERFQQLLRELFQFDCAELDFGIYRILNYKRKQVEDFIDRRLPKIVDEAFARYAAADHITAQRELEERKHEIIKSFGDQAFDARGQLVMAFEDTPLGQQYLEARSNAQTTQVADDLKQRVYNDLLTFFSRYYDDGDFVTKRRYGRAESYVIPYNGEEVLLHWANKDQYYVKTGERFSRYQFRLDDTTVAFELREAATEQNNNKSAKRHFVFAGKNGATWDEHQRRMTLFFEYRVLTDKEQQAYGKTEQHRPQERLNAGAVEAALQGVKDATLKARLAQVVNERGDTTLRKHLDNFTRRNTSDFFVHKNLRGFLARELDFFLKNEVLLLDELLGAEGALDHHVQRARVVRDVAEKLIDFLAQVEDFQKRLFLKKKFVVRTEWCATLDRVPEALWPEVLKNKAQLAEWQHLYALDEMLKKDGLFNKGVNKDFLKRHPSLVVDTRHFSADFKAHLLAAFDDLDAQTDGVLIKSENFQALRLLQEKYRERVKCIYIDPPYNTGSDEFLYRDNYQHSCWLAMMADRLRLAVPTLETGGTLLCSIDDTEADQLATLIESLYGSQGFLGTFVWRRRVTSSMAQSWLSTDHEYVLAYSTDPLCVEILGAERDMSKYNIPDGKGGFFASMPLTVGMNRSQRPNQWYALVNPKTRTEYWPPSNRVWGYYPPTMQQKIAEDRIIWPEDHPDRNMTTPRVKAYAEDAKRDRKPVSTWLAERGRNGRDEYDEHDAVVLEVGKNEEGTRALKSLFGEFGAVYPKPISLVASLVQQFAFANDFIIDFFAGSGTTAHAVINLKRMDGDSRRYVLVEHAEYFETLLLPRIKKVVLCEQWKDGKPAGGAGVSQLVKVQWLEQYEDTLNNLELPRAADGQKALELFGDEYLLRYVLDFETQGSQSLLNIEALKDPFAYRLQVQEGDERIERAVDLVETFNYLLGLQVQRIREFGDADRRYVAVLGETSGQRVIAVWRSMVGMEEDPKALRRDQKFIESEIVPALLGKGATWNRLFVNSPCYVKGTEAIEPELHRRMFAET